MKNVQKDYMFDYFIQGMDEKMQATLNMMYLNSCMIDEENHRREMEQMKEEIIQEVLSRITATVDELGGEGSGAEKNHKQSESHGEILL